MAVRTARPGAVGYGAANEQRRGIRRHPGRCHRHRLHGDVGDQADGRERAAYRPGRAVLLVEPTYKSHWEVPGGAVEASESPRTSALREVGEELRLDRPAGGVLAVDRVPPRPDRTEGLIVVFDGGTLADTAGVDIPADALRSRVWRPRSRRPRGCRRCWPGGWPRWWRRHATPAARCTWKTATRSSERLPDPAA